MATTSSKVGELYTSIVSDLVPFYENATLLPSPLLIQHFYNIEGAMGKQITIPLVNDYGTANVSISENADIITASGTNHDFDPTSVTLSVNKRGAATLVSTESLEDAGFDAVRNQVLLRLSRSLAQSTDTAGFRVMLSDSETALADISDVSCGGDDGYANSILGTADVCAVWSPAGMAFASKRSAEVKQFEKIQNDEVQMVATMRNGFKQVKPTFIRAISVGTGVSSNAATSANITQFATSVANLRAVNAETDDAGYYYAAITPGAELDISNQLSGVGAVSGGSIGSVAQDIANDVLLRSIVSQAIGLNWLRTNNLPTGLLSA